MPVPIRRAPIVVLALIAAAVVILSVAIWLLVPEDTGDGDRSIPPADSGLSGAVDAAPKDAAAATPADTTVAVDRTVDARKRYWRQIKPRRLRKMQRQHSGLFSLCFKRAARVSGNLPRKVNVVVHLKRGGLVKSVAITPASSPALRRCLMRMISTWRFPSDSKAQRLAFPIVFAR